MTTDTPAARSTPPSPGLSVDARMVALMRCVLAFAGLAFMIIDPTTSPGMGAPAYAALVGYCLWATVLLYWTTRPDADTLPPRPAHWGDVLFCAYLVTLTEGIHSIYFSFFLFSILVAAFTRGFREGLWVAVTSVALFVLIGLRETPDAVFRLDQSLFKAIYLLILGYTIAVLGGLEVEQRRRLRLLHEVNQRWNPRLGYDHALGAHLESMLAFFGARSCVLVQRRPTEPPAWFSYHAVQGRPGQAGMPRSLDAAAGESFMALPDDHVAFYEASPAWSRMLLRQLRRLIPHQAPQPQLEALNARLADQLETDAFVSVPFSQRDGTCGRVYMTPGRARLSRSDAAFAAQLVTAISRVVESVQLIDELVSRAADHERYRISMDIHDTTIQPYIGLKLGLDALHRRSGGDNPLSADIGELRDMADATINDLRRYTATLREDAQLAGNSLVHAIGQQAEQFQRFYGIQVDLQHDDPMQFSARLGNAVLHILAEGLSNVLRHTQARTVQVSLHRVNGCLTMEIANQAAAGLDHGFAPRTITQRARALGGRCSVAADGRGYTVVRVEIPL